jgi:hypothetical protein
MDWDQLATVAQLVTGIATLAVAVLLVSQLKVQHRDSERDFAFANENRQQNMALGLYGDEATAQLHWKASSQWDELTEEEANRFRFLQQQLYLMLWNAWRLKRDGDSLDRFKVQWGQLLEHPGLRRFYEKWGRDICSRDSSFLECAEGVYRDLESQAA